MIIITGFSGFIGKKLLSLVKEEYKNEEIFVIDEKNNNLVNGDGLDKIPTNPRLIFHLAAATDTSKRDQSCNNIGTKNLLKALKGIGSTTHFIFTSSQAVFSGRPNCKKQIDEKTKPAVNNEYGKTKLEAERFLLSEAKKKGFKLTIIRLPTVWGENPRKNSFLNFLKDLVDKNSIFSRLDWPGKVGLINVNDAAKYILRSSIATPQKPKITPISVENLTMAEIFEKIATKEGKTYKQINVPNFIWNIAKTLRPYLKYFENILPIKLYNYFWRASIIVDSPLACKVNIKGTKFK